MWMDILLMPKEFIEARKLGALEKNGKVLVEVRKGVCGLKKADKLAHEVLKAFLKPNGC